jgi:hypothetical protein
VRQYAAAADRVVRAVGAGGRRARTSAAVGGFIAAPCPRPCPRPSGGLSRGQRPADLALALR